MSGQQRNHHGSVNHLSDPEEDWDSGLSSEPSSPPRSPCHDSPQQPHVQAARPQGLKTPQLHGHGDWKKFEKMFCFVAEMCRWTEDDKLENLKVCLQDQVMTYLRMLPPEVGHNYQDLMRLLRQRFQEAERPKTIRQQLPDVKQQVYKTLRQFVDRIRGLVSTAYQEYGPAATEKVDDVTKGCFLHGLRDRTSAMSAATCGLLPNIQTALGAVKDVDAIRKIFGRVPAIGRLVEARRPRSPHQKPTKVSIAVQAAEDVPPDKPPGNSSRSRKPDHGRCFGRHQRNHFCSKCPLPESPKGNGQQ